MISVAEARQIVVSRSHPLPAEVLPLSLACGRVLAADVVARISHPATAISAMDGYAVRAIDLVHLPIRLRLVGVAAAGASMIGAVPPGGAARILTGAPLPEGADSIVIQEHTRLEGDAVVVLQAPPPGRWIRAPAIDFQRDTVLLATGRRLNGRDLALAAAANVASVAVRQRPRIALLATGDELVPPGEWRDVTQTVNSNTAYLSAELTRFGAIPLDLGIVGDERSALRQRLLAASHADALLTIGGASVGDRDLVRPVLDSLGFTLGFERVAMRPGKPTTFGWLGNTPVLMLPGNPVSAAVAALRLVRPLVESLLGLTTEDTATPEAMLATALPANDEREDHLRATLEPSANGGLRVRPFSSQDSALTALLAAADCLILRAPHAPAAKAGDVVRIIPLE